MFIGFSCSLYIHFPPSFSAEFDHWFPVFFEGGFMTEFALALLKKLKIIQKHKDSHRFLPSLPPHTRGHSPTNIKVIPPTLHFLPSSSVLTCKVLDILNKQVEFNNKNLLVNLNHWRENLLNQKGWVCRQLGVGLY